MSRLTGCFVLFGYTTQHGLTNTLYEFRSIVSILSVKLKPISTTTVKYGTNAIVNMYSVPQNYPRPPPHNFDRLRVLKRDWSQSCGWDNPKYFLTSLEVRLSIQIGVVVGDSTTFKPTPIVLHLIYRSYKC